MKKKKKKSMWDMMQSVSKEFPVQKERINKKQKLLEDHGVDVDISHIEKPEPTQEDYKKKDKQSMWDMMQSMENKFQTEKEYLDDIEAAYDKAIKEILGPEFLPK